MGRVGGIGYPGRAPVIDTQGRILMYWRTKSAVLLSGGTFGSAYTPDISAMDPATGDRRWLDRAIYWARTGLPFLFAYNRADTPGMRYASIPVFGTTFYTHSWLGVPVQWNANGHSTFCPSILW